MFVFRAYFSPFRKTVYQLSNTNAKLQDPVSLSLNLMEILSFSFQGYIKKINELYENIANLQYSYLYFSQKDLLFSFKNNLQNLLIFNI